MRGRKPVADPGTLYALAQQLYWDLKTLSEGRLRWFLDEDIRQHLNQQIESAEIQLTEGQKARAVEVAEEDIRTGKIQEGDKAQRIREIEEIQLSVTRAHLSLEAVREVGRPKRVPGEPEVMDVLLNQNATSEQIRDVCKGAFMRINKMIGSESREVEVPAWPVLQGSLLPTCLAQFADEYVAALRNPRFPGCDVSQRPTNHLKRLWFLARALAGAVCGVKTRTAVNLVGSLRPEQLFHKAHAAKSARRLKPKAKQKIATS